MKRFLLLSLLLACAGHVSAATYVVDSNSDANVGACTDAPNDCTLRGAITTANANPGADVINFAIPGAGVHTIVVGSGTGGLAGLPLITDAVTIDGTTQPGFTTTPLIELNGSALGVTADGLSIGSGSGGSLVRALAINRFGGNGILISSSDGNSIVGCFIGTHVSGSGILSNGGSGVFVRSPASNNIIGGTTPGSGNLISGNDTDGVRIMSVPDSFSNIEGTLVQGNFIGTDVTGTVSLGNGGEGVLIGGSGGVHDNTIGGTAAGARNLISGNSGSGVKISDTANLVQGNFIGTDITGTVALGNGFGVFLNQGGNVVGGTVVEARNIISGNGFGVAIVGNSGDSGSLVQGNFIGTDVTGTLALGNTNTGVVINGYNNTIGGNAADAGNTIAYSANNGITITAGNANQIFGNSIYRNGGLGLDLSPPGVTPNDDGDIDGGANNRQNFPVIESAVSSGGTTIIQGTLSGPDGNSFFIDLYGSVEADPTGFGEGQRYLGFVRFTSDARGSFSFTASGDLAGQFITATATSVSFNDTSEFSAALLATGGSTPSPTPTPSASPTPTPAAQPLNISTRLRVKTGDNVLIGGFIIRGSAPKKIIVRALGQSLSNSGIADVLADPVIELHGPGGELIAQNDNWGDTQQAQIQASGLAPENDLESAIVATLPPEGYTVIVRGKNETTGVALVEGYDLDSAASSEFANISTRGFVEAGDGVLIGGFILGGKTGDTQVALRGVGPSLANTGLSNVLANPTLDLRDANGTRIGFNDDWMDNPAQAVQLSANGLDPQDPRESGIFTTLAPGLYTVILAGKDGGTGVGLVEVYKIEN